MLFTLKAGKALYAWMHDPSLFDCAIQRSYCTLSKDEICGEKKPLGVTCKSITYFIQIHSVVKGKVWAGNLKAGMYLFKERIWKYSSYSLLPLSVAYAVP